MYIVADSGAYVSKDDGDTWVKTIDISGDIIYGCSINRNNVSIVTQKSYTFLMMKVIIGLLKTYLKELK